MKKIPNWLIMGFALSVFLSACTVATQTISMPDPQSSTPQSTSGSTQTTPDSEGERELEIVTLLPFDGIPAIDEPDFLNATQADEEYAPDELVIGVEFNGDARAYSIPLLSSHEIVNDTVGGEKIAVTW